MLRSALGGILLLALCGCASTAYEPPPEVIEQPRKITADEAVTEGEAAREQALTESLEAELTERGVPAAEPAAPSPPETAAVAAVPAPSASAPPAADNRFRPTERSTQEIRTQNANAPQPLDFEQRLDHMHDRIYTWGQGMVEATDQRFAPKDKELLPTPAAPFRLGTMLEGVNHNDGFKLDIDINLDIALKLPNTEQRLKLFVTSSELDEAPRFSGEDPGLRAGLRYQFQRHFDLDLGIRVDWPPVAFTSLKWTREYDHGKWSFYPLGKLFAETDEGLGYSAAMTFDRWSGRHLLRSSTFTKRRLDRSKNEWSQTFVYARAHQLIVPDRYGSYISANDIGNGWGIRLFGKDEGEYYGEDKQEYYEVGLFFRKPARNRWLYWHVEPIVRWDRRYDWDADPGIRVGIDILFWDLARPAR